MFSSRIMQDMPTQRRRLPREMLRLQCHHMWLRLLHQKLRPRDFLGFLRFFWIGSGIRDELIFVLPMFQAMFQTCFKHGGGQAAPCQLQGHSGRRTKEQSVAARASKFSLPMFQGMFQTCFKHRGSKPAPGRGDGNEERKTKEGWCRSPTKKLLTALFQTWVSVACFRVVFQTCFRCVFQTCVSDPVSDV